MLQITLPETWLPCTEPEYTAPFPSVVSVRRIRISWGVQRTSSRFLQCICTTQEFAASHPDCNAATEFANFILCAIRLTLASA
jgi:hypothetical protein